MHNKWRLSIFYINFNKKTFPLVNDNIWGYRQGWGLKKMDKGKFILTIDYVCHDLWRHFCDWNERRSKFLSLLQNVGVVH
jgi:hypothetical protein